jgi:DNA polymerase kappa
MPGFVGAALCRRGPEFGMPKAELIFVPPNFAKYEVAAEQARAIFREYDPQMSSYSLDEAYLDLT